MNKFKIQSAFLCLAFSLAGQAQEIKTLVPWSYAPGGVQMGMSGQDLKTSLPDIKPLLGMFDNDPPSESEAVKDGMYASRLGETGYNEAMAYGVNGGRVTQVYWSSKNMASIGDVRNIRKQLAKMHEESRLGYKAKVTKDGIAKITTEVFSVKNTDIVISLSSALGETEIAVLDTSDPKVDPNELYFSFEKQRERLRTELSRLTKTMPKDEADADCLDVLKEAISDHETNANGVQSNQESSLRQAPDSDDPQVKKIDEDIIKINTDKSSRRGLGYTALFIVSAFILACAFLVIRRASRKRR